MAKAKAVEMFKTNRMRIVHRDGGSRVYRKSETKEFVTIHDSDLREAAANYSDDLEDAKGVARAMQQAFEDQQQAPQIDAAAPKKIEAAQRSPAISREASEAVGRSISVQRATRIFTDMAISTYLDAAAKPSAEQIEARALEAFENSKQHFPEVSAAEVAESIKTAAHRIGGAA